jgi:hypothetical protein
MFSTLKRLVVACMFVVLSFLAMAPVASAHAGTCSHYTTHHWVSNSTVHWVYYQYAVNSSSGHKHWYWVDVYIFGNFWTSYWASRWC